MCRKRTRFLREVSDVALHAEDILTTINTFFEEEELQALPLDRISNKRPPHVSFFQHEGLLRCVWLPFRNLLSEIIHQALGFVNVCRILVAISEGLHHYGPNSLGDFSCCSVVQTSSFGINDRLTLLETMGNRFCSARDVSNRIVLSAMDPICTTA
jgi:hypothetical protein